MPKKVGSRVRTVTQIRNQGRFPLTHGYGYRLRSLVPGYAWLGQLAKRCVTDRFRDYACNRVTGYAKPCLYNVMIKFEAFSEHKQHH